MSIDHPSEVVVAITECRFVGQELGTFVCSFAVEYRRRSSLCHRRRSYWSREGEQCMCRQYQGLVSMDRRYRRQRQAHLLDIQWSWLQVVHWDQAVHWG